jgi:hypothetical protein
MHRRVVTNSLVTWTILTSLAAFFNPVSAPAQYFAGPITQAQGGGGRAALSSTEGPSLNPASVAHFKAFTLSGYYSYGDLAQNTPQRTISGVLVDNNSESIVPAALTYSNRKIGIPGSTSQNTESNWEFSVAKFLFPQFSMGLTARYFISTPVSGSEESLVNSTVGFLWTPWQSLGIGLVSYNFVNNHKLGVVDPSTGLGINYIFADIVRVKLDTVLAGRSNPKGLLDTSMGFEFILANEVFLRAGYQWATFSEKDLLGVGFGWDGPKLGIDYSFQKNQRRSDEFTHSFDLRFYL